MLLLLSLLACTPAVRKGTISTPPDPPPDFETDTTLRGWTASDSAALALDWGLLRRTPLPQNVQEIRIWTGLAMGAQRDLLRLTRRGNKIEGLMALYWEVERQDKYGGTWKPGVPIDAVVRHTIAGRCGPPRRLGDVEACRLHFTRLPDWKAIWDSLQVLGVWTLPDQKDLPRRSLGMDGWSMTVEVRHGDRYRSYAYSNPDGGRHPAEKAATEIGRIDHLLWPLVPRSHNERRYRGRLDVGVGWSEFRACGGSTVWGVQGTLGTRLDSLRMKVPGRDSTARHVFYAELRGMLAYPGLAREWGTPYQEILQVDTVFIVHSSLPERC